MQTEDYINKCSIRQLKTFRKWHRAKRRIQVCRETLRSLTEIIKNKQADYYKKQEEHFKQVYLDHVRRQIAQDQMKLRGLI